METHEIPRWIDKDMHRAKGQSKAKKRNDEGERCRVLYRDQWIIDTPDRLKVREKKKESE